MNLTKELELSEKHLQLLKELELDLELLTRWYIEKQRLVTFGEETLGLPLFEHYNGVEKKNYLGNIQEVEVDLSPVQKLYLEKWQDKFPGWSLSKDLRDILTTLAGDSSYSGFFSDSKEEQDKFDEWSSDYSKKKTETVSSWRQ